MAVTISLSTLLGSAAIALVVYVLYKLHHIFSTKPKAFQKFWADQGVRGKPYKAPLGQLPDIQQAAESDQIVEYACSMAREYGLLQTQVVGPECQIVCYDPEVVRYICTTKAQFYHKASNVAKEIMRPLLHNGLLLSEDAYWKQQRALISPGFHFWYLEEMVPIIVSCIEGWVSKSESQIASAAGGADPASIELEMSHELATMTLDSVATAAFGSGFRADPALADRFIHSLKQVLDNMQARTLNMLGFLPIIKSLPLPSLNAIKEGCNNIDEIVASIVRDRKEGRKTTVAGGKHAGSEKLAAENGGEAERRRDLLDLLLDAQANMPDGQVLTDRGVEEESINFIAAGAETTSNLCVWMLHRIVTDQRVLEKVRDEVDRVCGTEVPTTEALKELKYLEAVAYEALRLHPPAPTIPKYAIEDHEMTLSGGRTITVPAGTTVLMNANVMHRLEEYWPEPEVFKPERFLAGGDQDQSEESSATKAKTLTPDEKARKAAQPFAFLGFSAGPRKCVGKNLAMLEIKIIFAMLLQRFDITVVPGQYIAANPITRLPRNGIRMTLRKRTTPLASDEEVMVNESDAKADDDNADATVRQRATVSVLKPLGMI